MAFIGNTPAESYVVTVKDSFNGTGSQTDFTLSQASTTNDVRVVVENVVQEPTTAYTVTGTTLAFTSAPPSGTGNIYVIHLGPAVATAVPPETFGVGSIYGASDPDTAITFEGSGVTTFDQNGSEAARFDASGNFLVGKTAFGYSTVGAELRDVGLIQATRDGGAGLVVNRKTSDGELIGLYKDQSLVGSIGSRNAGTSFIALSTTSNTGLTGSGAAVCPSQNGGLADNAVDFGFNTARWKDLYLSGGVYVGGTGAANYLDDYEEGTFTPTLTGSIGGTATLSNSEGAYVKIGKLVHIVMAIGPSSFSGVSGNLFMGGLPFSIEDTLSNTANDAIGSVGQFSSLGTNVATITIQANQNSNVFEFRYWPAAGATGNQGLPISFCAGSGGIRASATYYTTA